MGEVICTAAVRAGTGRAVLSNSFQKLRADMQNSYTTTQSFMTCTLPGCTPWQLLRAEGLGGDSSWESPRADRHSPVDQVFNEKSDDCKNFHRSKKRLNNGRREIQSRAQPMHGVSNPPSTGKWTALCPNRGDTHSSLLYTPHSEEHHRSVAFVIHLRFVARS